MSTDILATRFIYLILTLTIVSACDSAFAAEGWRDYVTVPETPTDVLKADLTPVECLALNLYHEARGEGSDGREVVVAATFNRVDDWWYPDTICDVVKQTGVDRETGKLVAQFSWTLDGKSDQATEEPEKFREVYLLAIEYLFMGKPLTIEWAPYILSYHAPWVDPDWGDMIYLELVEGHLVYARLEDFNLALLEEMQ